MRHIFLPVIAFVISVISSCGQPVCVMGVGDCTKMFSNAPTSSTSSSSGNLTIGSGNLTTFRLSTDHPVFTVSGGTEPYNWSVVAGNCGTFPTPTTGSLNLTTASSLCTIQVTDSTSPNANFGKLNITVTQ